MPTAHENPITNAKIDDPFERWTHIGDEEIKRIHEADRFISERIAEMLTGSVQKPEIVSRGTDMIK